MRIGSRTLRNNLFVAPMAGVTDRPFRQLCKKFGAGLAVSEMVASNSLLWGSEKTRRRANHEGEVEPISVQIAGADPDMMAEAARFNVERGAQIVDINRSEEHTSELQSRFELVCRLLLEKKKETQQPYIDP